MKRQHLLLLVVMLIVACAPRPGKWQKVVKVKTTSKEFRVQRLGILPFRSSDSSVGDLVADSVAANLLDSDLIVVERAFLTAIVQEQGLSITGLTETTDYSKIGHLADVDFLVLGSVRVLEALSFGEFMGFFKISSLPYIDNAAARIVDASTGQVVISCFYKIPDGAVGNRHWLDPNLVGKALAGAIMDALDKKN